ncbi:MAG: hypothetical protein QXJ68_02555 [Methanocellales archaeon]
MYWGRHRLSTTISIKHYEILKKYENKYKSKKGVIEKALELLERQSVPELSRQNELWSRMGKELDVACFPRYTVELVMAGRYEEAIKNNYLPFYLEWYYQKPLHKLNLEQILYAFKEIFEASNIFKSIATQQVDKNNFRVVGYIGMNYETSEFYAKYISYFLERYCNCRVVSSITDTGITLDISRK